MTHPPTPEFNAGARYARAHILRALRRAIGHDNVSTHCLTYAIEFILAMPTRAAKRKGGTGRK